MFATIRSALGARHAAIIEAEAIVANGDHAALRIAMDRAADSHRAYSERLHYERVVVTALRRRRQLEFADRRTRDTIIEKWSWRRGSKVRS